MQFGVLARAALLVALFLVPCVHAAEPTEAELEQRRQDAAERYEQGVNAYQDGRHKDAIDLFLEADSLAPSSALSFNIARAYEKIKDSSNALKWYRDYLRREPGASDKDQVADLVKGYEAVLKDKGVQQLTVLSTPATATVRVDGRPVGVTPWTGDIPPGVHSVQLSLRGYADSEQQVTLPADKSLDVNIRLQPASAAPAAPPASDAPAQAPKNQPATSEATAPPSDAGTKPQEPEGIGIVTYVVLGAGVATLGAAGAFEYLRRSAEDDAKQDGVTQVEFRDAQEEAEQRQKVARILAGAGAAITLTGGVLLAIDLFGGSSASARAPQNGLTASAACTPSDCYAWLKGSF